MQGKAPNVELECNDDSPLEVGNLSSIVDALVDSDGHLTKLFPVAGGLIPVKVEFSDLEM